MQCKAANILKYYNEQKKHIDNGSINDFHKMIIKTMTEDVIPDNIIDGTLGRLCFSVKEYELANENHSNYVGDIGKIITFDAKLEQQCNTRSRYGQNHMIVMNSNGNFIRAFLKPNTAIYNDMKKVVVGDYIHAEGIVKGHDIFNGVKYTNINKMKLLNHRRCNVKQTMNI